MCILKKILLCAYTVICIIRSGRSEGSIIGGPAEINIKSITKCPEPEQYKYTINVNRHKVNRTHEAFTGDLDLGVPLDNNVGIYVNVAKKAKDNYKPNAYEFKDDNACFFLMKWIGNGFIELLGKMNQPQTCPLAAGSYNVKDFLIDFRQLPSTLPYGDFRADAYFTQNGDNIICARVFLVTKPLSPFNG